MTIKIIKQGKLPQEREYMFRCYNCKTEFSATEADGKRYFDQLGGDYIEVICPLCEHECTSTERLK